jgi:hypothetical protein
MDRYELSDRQEERAQHHVCWLKALWISLAIGAIFLILPRAVPWFSSGMPETAMGRLISSASEFNLGHFMTTAGLHMLLAVCYGFILAPIVYRFEIKTAAFVGVVAGLALYGINLVLFRFVLGTPASDEGWVVITHLVFSLFFTAAYKGISVPDASQVS